MSLRPFSYLVLRIASGNLDASFLRGNLKLFISDFLNLSSISFLNSINSVSILGLM